MARPLVLMDCYQWAEWMANNLKAHINESNSLIKGYISESRWPEQDARTRESLEKVDRALREIKKNLPKKEIP